MAKAAKKRSTREQKLQQAMICDGLSFAAAEAYKLLRTNLQFSLPEKSCQIVGLTSSVRGEGKSTTAVNLSYTLAQSGKRVLLIDADMRLPSVASKLDVPSKPGLSNLLAGLNTEKSCLMVSKHFENWYILPAGDIPPNPSELLGSERMHTMLERYEKVFDFIVIDLPPVGVVTDALVVSQWTDGIILVVRQNFSERRALNDCMYQIRKIGGKFLGFVMTDAAVGEGSYKRYGKYGSRYGYGYGYGYDTSSRKSSSRKDAAFMNATMDRNPAAEQQKKQPAQDTDAVGTEQVQQSADAQ